jgi:hypothetical protein
MAFPVAAADPAKVLSTAGAVTKDLGVQTRLPTDSTTAEPPPKINSEPMTWRDESFSIPGVGAVIDLMKWALIVVAAIAIIAVLASIVSERLHSSVPASLSPPVPLPETPQAPADPRDLLARADQLAAAGQYAEAMHYVLLAATAIIGRGKPSLTSWELLRDASLAPPRLDALRDLVIRAERAWFGQRPTGADDYRHARSCYEAFAEPA